MISCITGWPVYGIVALDIGAQFRSDLPITGCGTNTSGACGRPPMRVTDCTTLTNLSVWTATVGTPYCVSSVIAWVDTAGAQVLQWPTPMMAACPCRVISFHSSGSSLP